MKYLVSLFTGLGNAIQKTPLISAIHRIDAKAEVDVIGDDRFGALSILSNSTEIRVVHKTSARVRLATALRWAFKLHACNYDVFFLPADASPRWLRYIAYSLKAGRVFQHIGIYRMRVRDRLELFFKPAKVTLVPLVAGRHEIELALDLLESLVGRPIERDLQTWIAIAEDPTVRGKFGLPAEYICLQFGAANGARTAKRWPLRHFSELISALEKKHPELGLVVVGDEGDYEHFIKPMLEDHPALINTAGLTTIAEVASIISTARLVLCHDSGLMHVADAKGRPLIALYGPTDHYRTAPCGKRSFILKRDLPCVPCMYNNSISEAAALERCPRPECMHSITPDNVLEEMERILLNDF